MEVTSENLVCSNCKSPVQADHKHCHNCGAKQTHSVTTTNTIFNDKQQHQQVSGDRTAKSFLVILWAIVLGVYLWASSHKQNITTATSLQPSKLQWSPEENAVTKPGSAATKPDSVEADSANSVPSTISLRGTKDLVGDVNCSFDRVEIASGYKDCGHFIHSAPAGAVYLIVYYSAVNDRKQTLGINMPRFVIRTDDDLTIIENHNASSYIAYCYTDKLGTSNSYIEFQPGIPVQCVATFELPMNQLTKHPLLCIDSLDYNNSVPLWADRAEESTLVLKERKEREGFVQQQEQRNATGQVATGNGGTADDLVEQILKSEQAGNTDSVSQLLSQLQALPKPILGDQNTAGQINKQGLQFLKAKQYDLAAERFREASSKDPSDAIYLSNLGFAEMQLGQLGQAEQDLISSLGVAPDRQMAWADLGLVLAKKGQQENAVACLLVGCKVSNGALLGYIRSLQSDDDAAARNVACIALSKVQPIDQASTSIVTSTSNN